MSDRNNDSTMNKVYELISLAESGEDYDQALSLTAVCAESPDQTLRMNALHCFGYIARVYRRLDLDIALPLIHKGEQDPVPDVAAAARDALEDLEVFLPGFKAERAI